MEDSKLREINEIVSSPENMAKNSVSLLMEAASQVGETVTFNYVDELGLSNTRFFICEVKVGRLTKCKGSGNNKKMAKANAAEQALELIRGRTVGSTNLPVKSKMSPSHRSSQATRLSPRAVPLSPVGGDVQDSANTADSNPVGALQEMCSKYNWTPPSYDLASETGESHMKTFIYECKVESWIAQGKGKSKKTAKKLAAENLLSMISEAVKSSPPHELYTCPMTGSPLRNFPSKWPKVSPPLGASASTSRQTQSPVAFLSSLLYDDIECEDEQTTEETSHGIPQPVFEDVISKEFCLSLKDRGKTSSFTVKYHDLPEKGYSGNYMCFVRLDTRPPTVCSGMGPTKEYAHEKAAQNALHHLNTVCS